MWILLAATILAAILPTTLAWGAAGHEIVATIAQVHLHPNVRQKLCDILPPEAKCHLAPIAAWADQVRMRYPGTGAMHYVNAKQDYPAEKCLFGEEGWVDEDINVLTAIMNMTHQIQTGQGSKDISLRFLTHFLGDLHQPLHLCGRDKGGNGAMFRFEGRMRNLHSVWDSGIITKNIRELGNYTTPLPSKQIESQLLGAIFDPYVRFIIWEGIRTWWPHSIEGWLKCPSTGDPYPHSSTHDIPPSSSFLGNSFRSASSIVLSLLPNSIAEGIRSISPIPLDQYEGFNGELLASTPGALATAAANGTKKENVACPYTWASEIHGLNCDLIWPKEYEGPHHPLIELDTDQYVGRIRRENLMERLLAMGGLRLAKIVNEILGDEGEQGIYMGYE